MAYICKFWIFVKMPVETLYSLDKLHKWKVNQTPIINITKVKEQLFVTLRVN